MFDIKQIKPSGEEAIFSASSLHYLPAGNDSPSAVVLETISALGVKNFARLEEGKVFVMNAAGQTVAKYVLGETVRDERQRSADAARQIRSYMEHESDPKTIPSLGRV